HALWDLAVACARHVPGCDVTQRAFAVLRLVVEEYVGAERAKELGLVGAAQKQTFVQTHIPRAQRANHAFVRRRRARRDECGSDRTLAILEFRLQTMQTAQEILERPP